MEMPGDKELFLPSFTASTWCWVLEPMDKRHTRVVSRLRCRHDPTTLSGLAGMLRGAGGCAGQA
jgi:hypothetical protein